MIAAGAAMELAVHRFGGVLNDGEREVSVGASATEVIGGDPERVFLILVNMGTDDLIVSWRVDVSSTKGIQLSPNGGAIELNAVDDGPLVTRPMFAISSGTATPVYIIEQRRETRATIKGEV